MKKEWGFRENNQIFNDSIPALTSLRFFAAFYVILFHAHEFSGINAYLLNNFFNSGYLAVDFFFILSGFILSYTYYPQIKSKSFFHKEFLIKRVARIYPVHLFTLLFMLALIAFIKLSGIDWDHDMSSSNVYEFFTNLFMVHAWDYNYVLSYNQPSWSISAEFFAYILFPLFVFFIDRGSSLIKVIVATSFFLSSYFIAYGFFEVTMTKITYGFTIVRIVPDFLLGVTTFLLFYRYSFTFDINKHLTISFLLLCFCFYMGNLDFIVVPLFAWVIYLLADQARHGQRSFLNNNILQFLGQVSYSLYMVHFPIWVGFMHMFLGNYMGFNNGNVSLITIYSVVFFTILLMFPCAILTYKYIEVPSRRWIIKTFIKSQ